MTDAGREALRFSIVVPSFNHAHFLPRTLDSILGQDYRPLEVIVADGGSDDGTVDILNAYAKRHPELTWLSEPDEGPADAVNKGLDRVIGDIVGIQSSDDVYYAGTFREVAAAFAADPTCGFVYGDVEGIDEHDNILYRRSLPDFSWEAFFGVSMSIPQSSIFFRRSVAEQTGGWNGRYYGCDLEYWLRLLFRTNAKHIPRPLSGWRSYPGQRTRPEHARKIWDGYWRMIDESPDIAAAPARIRRLARASKHIMALRFPPRRSRLTVWRHLLIGFVLHPAFWRYNPPRKLLEPVPGFRTARRIYHSLRQRAGSAPTPRRATAPRSGEHHR